MKYRADIDGLRAVAVLPVVFYHAGVSGPSGGFVGVDIFFVISGFLITSIVAREIAEGRFSLLSFYERRARRIRPTRSAVSFREWMRPSQIISAHADKQLFFKLFRATTKSRIVDLMAKFQKPSFLPVFSVPLKTNHLDVPKTPSKTFAVLAGFCHSES